MKSSATVLQGGSQTAGNVTARGLSIDGRVFEKGWTMMVEKRIDDMIEAGWHVLDSDFDTAAFQHWRKQAFKCVNDLLGPDHTYTRSFKDCLQSVEGKKRSPQGGAPIPRPEKDSP
ncbi:MAG: hypothetical protein HY913_05695 [Desulfomonile tiedjei]|nr:hypothetical protein [Desulfomonile tiedjei]